MQEAYIVAGYRTAVGKSKRGGFRFTRPDDLAIDVIRGLLASVPQLDPKQVDDVIVGNAVPEAEQGLQVGRIIAARAVGFHAPGMTVNRYCASGITALVVGLQPLLTALVAGVLLGEKVRPAQWVGLGLGFSGVALVVAGKVATVPAGALAGMLLPALVALLGITAGTLYQKRFCPSFDLRTGSVIQYLPCVIAMAVLAYATETMAITWSGEFVFALGWLVLVLSLGAVSLLNLLIRRGGAVNVASLFYLTPPTTALIAWAMFGETLTGWALVGMALAAAGVWLARQTR